MKNFRLLFTIWFGFALLLGVCSCTRFRGDSLSILTWNTQTFFDSVNDGTEFSEFLSTKNHNLTRYRARLQNVCSVLNEAKADIVVLCEIENAEVVADIIQNMQNPLFYRHSAFSKDDTAAFGCAVLSRFPIESVTAHQVELFANGERAHSPLRPILQVIVRAGKQRIGVFACHLKSKKGESNGKNTTFNNELRRAQELVLATRISELLQNKSAAVHAVLIAGDFNQPLTEFAPCKTDDSAVLLRGTHSAVTAFASPCETAPMNQHKTEDTMPGVNGTYFYGGEWEYIDHIFLVLGANKNAHFDASAVLCNGNLLNAEQTPNRYEVFSGRGVSDHLPLKAIIGLKDSS